MIPVLIALVWVAYNIMFLGNWVSYNSPMWEVIAVVIGLFLSIAVAWVVMMVGFGIELDDDDVKQMNKAATTGLIVGIAMESTMHNTNMMNQINSQNNF